MAEAAEVDGSAPERPRRRRRSLARRIAGLLVGAVVGAVLLFLGLSVAAIAVTPPSTLMIGRWLRLEPVARETAPLSAISPHLVRLVVTSEDARFCRHRGVDWDELRQVIDAGAQRGASTIAMQTAKNVFLWPDRSVVRKAVELPIALWIDFLWGKSRVIEVYLNIAEWGEGVFGAEAAARAHFGKSAADLTQMEAALLATALPNPRARNPGAPSAGHRRLAERLVARARQAGDLSACVARGSAPRADFRSSQASGEPV